MILDRFNPLERQCCHGKRTGEAHSNFKCTNVRYGSYLTNGVQVLGSTNISKGEICTGYDFLNVSIPRKTISEVNIEVRMGRGLVNGGCPECVKQWRYSDKTDLMLKNITICSNLKAHPHTMTSDEKRERQGKNSFKPNTVTFFSLLREKYLASYVEK